MKKQKLLSRLLIPVLCVLVLLPPLCCLVFHVAAKNSAKNQTSEELSSLLNEILPEMRRIFAESDSETDENVKAFLTTVSKSEREHGGDAQLLILNGYNRLVYPHDETTRNELASFAEEIVAAINSGELSAARSVEEWQTSDKADYLICVYDIPTVSSQLGYLIAFCPTAEIGTWVGEASKLVLAISYLLCLPIAAIVWLVAKSVTAPLEKLSRTAQEIGNGNFVQSEKEFSVSELENLRVSMNRMSVLLENSDKAQKTFFQNISHELRTPLMSIGGYAQAIEQGVFENPREAAKIIEDESARLTETINELLTLSRLDAEEKTTLLPMFTDEIVADALDKISGVALQQKKVLVADDLPKNAVALGDERLVGQILDNFLSNAVRHAEKTVRVSVENKDGFVYISVADDGRGISEADLPHIFERGYKGEGGHFGIGLAICASAAKKIDAEIRAENIQPHGARFTLKLTVAVADENRK